jgi:hypothetical protein
VSEPFSRRGADGEARLLALLDQVRAEVADLRGEVAVLRVATEVLLTRQIDLTFERLDDDRAA